jgi:hypothetical protein
MNKVALRCLFGLSILFAAIYLLIHSNFLDYLEGTNLDGSNSITWRSGIALLLITALTQWFSFWAFRRHIALRVFLGLSLSIAVAIVLFGASFAFCWEPHNPDGTFRLTWRSDLIILALISIAQGISFLILRLINLGRRNHQDTTTAAQHNI